MQVAIVRAIDREDFKGFWAAHRHWPADKDTIVEVADADFDPPAAEGEPSVQVPDMTPMQADGRSTTKFWHEGVRYAAAVDRIGRRTLAALRAKGSYISIELRTVKRLADVKRDDKGRVNMAGEANYLAELEGKITQLEREKEELKLRLARGKSREALQESASEIAADSKQGATAVKR